MSELSNNRTPCEELREFLYLFADDELGDEQKQALAKHVLRCEQCTDRVDAEMHVRHLIRRCYSEQAPSSLRTRVIARISTTHLHVEF